MNHHRRLLLGRVEAHLYVSDQPWVDICFLVDHYEIVDRLREIDVRVLYQWAGDSAADELFGEFDQLNKILIENLLNPLRFLASLVNLLLQVEIG